MSDADYERKFHAPVAVNQSVDGVSASSTNYGHKVYLTLPTIHMSGGIHSGHESQQNRVSLTDWIYEILLGIFIMIAVIIS